MHQAISEIKASLAIREGPKFVPKAEPKPEEKTGHTGFYCFKCKKSQYAASYTTTTAKNKKTIGIASCAGCKGKIQRFVKFSKE